MLINKGGSISCRLPLDTPDEVIDYLNRIKSSKNRKFSSVLAFFLIERVSEELESKESRRVTFQLPNAISETQLQLLKNPDNQKFIISILINSLNHRFDDSRTMEMPRKRLSTVTNIVNTVPVEGKRKIDKSNENFILNTFLESP